MSVIASWRRRLVCAIGVCAALAAAGPAAAAGFTAISGEAWNDEAVRRVLHTFAYGGQATEEQINLWANMAPADAIAEMLTFAPSNTKLSAPSGKDTDRLSERNSSLSGLRSFWGSSDPENNTPLELRDDFAADAWDYPQRTWIRAVRSRGLNPFRHRIAFWEANYHLAVNREVGVEHDQLVAYYDAILADLRRNAPYHELMATAAKSAAIAMQYGHRKNRFVDGACQCNEDFAREFHQLFFGILGDYDPSRHERVTIKNTARLLTDMSVTWREASGWDTYVTFGSKYHFGGPLTILDTVVQSNTADLGIDQLAQVAIQHPESLANLPVKIIAGLADDRLDDAKIKVIREAWAALPNKSLLNFLRQYATSTTFHNAKRRRHLSSFDRHMLVATQLTLTNTEAAIDLHRPQWGLNGEAVSVFEPRHNVFGGQTGVEAASSGDVFRSAYLRSTEQNWPLQTSGEQYGVKYTKDFRVLVPARHTEDFRVDRVAAMLWKRFMGSLKNFGPLERAHVYALLARGTDLATVIDETKPDAVYTAATMEKKTTLMSSMASNQLPLSHQDPARRADANRRVMEAIEFIIATPYMFVEEGL